MSSRDPMLGLIAEYESAKREAEQHGGRLKELFERVPPEFRESPSVCLGWYRDLRDDDHTERPHLVRSVQHLEQMRDESIALHPKGRVMYEKRYNGKIAELEGLIAKQEANPAFAAYDAAAARDEPLWQAVSGVQIKIINTPATTLEGAAAKACILRELVLSDSDSFDDLLPLHDARVVLSLADDLERLAKG